jgi:hypothetical protein
MNRSNPIYNGFSIARKINSRITAVKRTTNIPLKKGIRRKKKRKPISRRLIKPNHTNNQSSTTPLAQDPP